MVNKSYVLLPCFRTCSENSSKITSGQGLSGDPFVNSSTLSFLPSCSPNTFQRYSALAKNGGKKYASIPIKSCKYRGDQYDSGVTRWNDECKVHSYKSVDLSLCNGIAIYSHLEKLAKSYLRQLHSQPRYFNCTEEIENVTGVYNTDFNGKVYQTNLVATHQL